MVQQSDQPIESRKETLIEQRSQFFAKLEEMHKTLGLLETKIDMYGNVFLNADNEIVLFQN